MTRRDSIGQQIRDMASATLGILGNRYPALAFYRLRKLEKDKLRHILIALGVLLLGFLSHELPESFPWTGGIVGFVVSTELALLWYDYLELAKPRNKDLHIVNVFPAILERLRKAELPQGYQLECFPNGSVIRSDDVDTWIRQNPIIGILIPDIPIEKRILKYNEPYLLESFDYLLTRLHKSTKRFFNETKVSLRTELNPEELKKPGRTVMVGKTSYIASCLTNDACVNHLRRTGGRTESVYADLTEMFPVETRAAGDCILSIDDSQLSNHLGASTIAIFRQQNGSCVVILPVQGSSAARSAGLLAPTGSGSLDWADVEQASSKDLLSIIARGATRELCEEQGLLGLGRGRRALESLISQHSIETHVLGYYRWLDFGGLPQFCCISLVRGINVETLEPDRRELGPYMNAGGRRYERRRIEGMAALHSYSEELLGIPERLSLPLAVNLALVRDLAGGGQDSKGQSRLANAVGALFD